jgi:ADP-ribose pyrophosphatase YjhB (NUDIX family)
MPYTALSPEQKLLRQQLEYDSIVYATRGQGQFGSEIDVYPIHYSRLRTEAGWAGVGVLAQLRNHEGTPIWGLRGPKVLYPGTWNIAGGHLDKGEEWQDGLLRELREECGLDNKDYSSIQHAQTILHTDDEGHWMAVDAVYIAHLKPGITPGASEEMTDWVCQSQAPNPQSPALADYLKFI